MEQEWETENMSCTDSSEKYQQGTLETYWDRKVATRVTQSSLHRSLLSSSPYPYYNHEQRPIPTRLGSNDNQSLTNNIQPVIDKDIFLDTTIPPMDGSSRIVTNGRKRKQRPACYQMSYYLLFTIAACGLFATGTWCLVTIESTDLKKLEWNSLYATFLQSDMVAMTSGAFLFLWIPFGLWIANVSQKLWVKWMYGLLLCLYCCEITIFCIFDFILITENHLIQRASEEAWNQTLTNHPMIIDHLQQTYQCHGWHINPSWKLWLETQSLWKRPIGHASLYFHDNDNMYSSHRNNISPGALSCSLIVKHWLYDYYLPLTLLFLLTAIMGWIELISFITLQKGRKVSTSCVSHMAN